MKNMIVKGKRRWLGEERRKGRGVTEGGEKGVKGRRLSVVKI